MLSLSRVRLFATPNTPGFPVLHYLPDLSQILSIESVMPSSHPAVACPALNLSQRPSLWRFLARRLSGKDGPAGQETRIRSLCRRSPGEGNGNPLKYSCLENPMDRGASSAVVHGLANSNTIEHTHTHTNRSLRLLFDFPSLS